MNPFPFKIGEHVTCIHNKSFYDESGQLRSNDYRRTLTVGKEYQVLKIIGGEICVKTDDGLMDYIIVQRFKSALPEMNLPEWF